MEKIIGITYDLKDDWKPGAGEPADANAEHDSGVTVDGITEAFEAYGHRVKRIGNVFNLLSQIDDLDVDIVFNITEGYFGRNRESQVPIILEMKGIPYVGADGLTLGITLDKIAAKKFFMADKIPTPRYFEAESTVDLEHLNGIRFPLIVKPRFEGTSKGLTHQSRVEDFKSLKRQVELINKLYRQPALVEEFIKGSEFTVAVLGNKNPQPMPVVQVKIDGKENLGDDFFTAARVSIEKDAVEYVCPAKIPRKLSDKMQGLAVRAYMSVDCRDFARIDFRVDGKGNPYILEVNPLPSLSKEDAFFFIAKALGITYEEIINRILNFGLERYGLTKRKHKEVKA